jgi:hypothetical protein
MARRVGSASAANALFSRSFEGEFPAMGLYCH